jgi:glycerol-3-phosphate dehydrogenase
MRGLVVPPDLTMVAKRPWDVIVIGGGITGAGIMREVARLGFRVLLVEQNDFASGTSSRSAKLVHGGLHYLPHLQLGLVREAVRERERLVRDGTGLVDRQEVMLLTGTDRPRNWATVFGLGVYDLLARRRPHPRHLSASDLARHAPGLAPCWTDALGYTEATIDDVRLVLTVIRQGCDFGGCALNYVAVTDLLRDAHGRVNGVSLCDREKGIQAGIRARVVVNATGPWADGVRAHLGALPRLRLVRGSHLVFPRHRLPITRAIATRHPNSRKPVCFIPWQGVTIAGTTTVEDATSPPCAPRISPEEFNYLLLAAQALFPDLTLDSADVSATFAGIRPIADRRTCDVARASRDYAIWEEDGLLTIAGGKLTTFHPMALNVIRKLAHRLPDRPRARSHPPVLETLSPLPPDGPFDTETSLRLLARYGAAGLTAIAAMPAAEREPIPNLGTRWGELRWAARAERVRHLDDLLLRRVRVGLTVPEGGIGSFDTIRAIVQTELGWCDDRWQWEVERYRHLWQREHGLPEHVAPSTINPSAGIGAYIHHRR